MLFETKLQVQFFQQSPKIFPHQNSSRYAHGRYLNRVATNSTEQSESACTYLVVADNLDNMLQQRVNKFLRL